MPTRTRAVMVTWMQHLSPGPLGRAIRWDVDLWTCGPVDLWTCVQDAVLGRAIRPCTTRGMEELILGHKCVFDLFRFGLVRFDWNLAWSSFGWSSLIGYLRRFRSSMWVYRTP